MTFCILIRPALTHRCAIWKKYNSKLHVVSSWKLNWSANECSYYGIASNEDGLVTRIKLLNHLLTGYIPAKLELLNSGLIDVINFSGNKGLNEGRLPKVSSNFYSHAALSVVDCRATPAKYLQRCATRSRGSE